MDGVITLSSRTLCLFLHFLWAVSALNWHFAPRSVHLSPRSVNFAPIGVFLILQCVYVTPVWLASQCATPPPPPHLLHLVFGGLHTTNYHVTHWRRQEGDSKFLRTPPSVSKLSSSTTSRPPPLHIIRVGRQYAFQRRGSVTLLERLIASPVMHASGFESRWFY